MGSPAPLPPRPPGYHWHLVLGVALILPIPLIWLTIAMFATSDLKQIPVWASDAVIYSIPILSIIGFAILPARLWLRAGLGCLLVPIFCLVAIVWMIILSCNASGHCNNWSIV